MTPAGENRISWKDVDHATYEEMVSSLLSDLYGARRIDGAGGDGGVDCYFNTEEGEQIWQLKSHTGRVGASQKRQIIDSLRSVEDRNPASWHLAIPIDFTPAEKAWFDELAATVSFPIECHGLSWLNAETAKRPYLKRYFLDGGADDAIRMLQELHQEKAALADGALDAITRARTLADRLNSIDPHYVFSIKAGPEGEEIEIVPRYPGAEQDRPIRIHLEGTFPDTPEGRAARSALDDAIGYGVPVHLESQHIKMLSIDAPAGLGGSFEGGELSLRSTKQIELGPLRLQLRDGSDRLISELPAEVRTATRGISGLIIAATDSSGWLTMTIRASKDEGRVEVTLRTSSVAGILPAELEAAIGFVRAYRRPNRLTVLLEESGLPLVEEMPIDIEHPLLADDHRRFIDELATLQRVSGVHFEMPEELTPRDLREIDEGTRLLAGETILLPYQKSMSLALTPDSRDSPDLLSIVEDHEPRRIVYKDTVGVVVAGHTLFLGPGKVVGRVVAANGSEVTAAWAEGAEPTLELDFVDPPGMSLIDPNQ